MKRMIRVSLLSMAFPVLVGMDCQGNGQPNGNPNGPQTPTGALKITGVTPSAVDDKLFISGEFGDTQGTVMLGGVTLNVTSWGPANPKPQQIVCDLPRELSGDLQVQAGAEFSNVAQLTKWELNLLSRTTTPATAPSVGSHQIDISVKLIIRACLNNLLASTAPSITVLGAVSRDSTADIDAFGTITNPPPPGHNSHTIQAVKFAPQGFKIVYPGDPFDANVDLFSITGISCFATRGSGGGIKALFTLSGFYKLVQQIDSDVTTSDKNTGFATNTYFDTSQPVLFTFDGAYNIPSGSVPAKSDPNSILSWSDAAPSSPPKD